MDSGELRVLYSVSVLALALFVFLGGYALFLLGFAVFMYFENQKFGDNQFTMKLLPPPPRLKPAAGPLEAAPEESASVSSDWTAVPSLTVPARPAAGQAYSRAA